MSNGDIYRETILDHYRNPRNKGRLSNHDVSVQDSNPLCGDEIEIQLKVEAKSSVITNVVIPSSKSFV